jgi:hypothetical protein
LTSLSSTRSGLVALGSDASMANLISIPRRLIRAPHQQFDRLVHDRGPPQIDATLKRDLCGRMRLSHRIPR